MAPPPPMVPQRGGGGGGGRGGASYGGEGAVVVASMAPSSSTNNAYGSRGEIPLPQAAPGYGNNYQQSTSRSGGGGGKLQPAIDRLGHAASAASVQDALQNILDTLTKHPELRNDLNRVLVSSAAQEKRQEGSSLWDYPVQCKYAEVMKAF